jgi:siroheme synthase
VDTIVVLMGVGSLKSTSKFLIEGGLSPSLPVAVVEWGTTKNQRRLVGTLGSIAELAQKNGVKPPAVVIVGEVVNLGSKLSWFQTP